MAPVTGLRMPATASPDSSESPRRLVVDVLNRHGSCTTWDTTGFYWQLEPIPVGQAGCSPLQVMLWLGRLCSLLIADSSLAGDCQQSAHLEAVFCCKHSARYVFHRWFALLKFFSLLLFLSKSSTATSFRGGMRDLAKLNHQYSLRRRANTAHTCEREKKSYLDRRQASGDGK